MPFSVKNGESYINKTKQKKNLFTLLEFAGHTRKSFTTARSFSKQFVQVNDKFCEHIYLSFLDSYRKAFILRSRQPKMEGANKR